MRTFAWLHRKILSCQGVGSTGIAYHCSIFQNSILREFSVSSKYFHRATMPALSAVKSLPKNLTQQGKSVKLTDYDCLGFDLDNTICRYKIGAMVKLEYETLCQFLVNEKGYSSKHLYKPIEDNLDFMLKGLFLDVENGNVLRIGPDGHILHGTHGTRELTHEEKVKYYGEECRWQVTDAFSKNPLQTWNGPFSEKMRTLLDYFDMPAGLTFARVVDTLDEENGGPLNSYSIWPDLLEAIQNMFQKEHFQLNKGGYFKQMKADPQNYIHKCSEELLNWFKLMKSHNKLLFLVTGSNVDFASHTAFNSLGKDWLELFDIVVCFAKKPGFFTSNRPFVALNGFEEIGPVEDQHLVRGSIYTYGNWSGLHEFLKKHSNLKDPKIVYFGDNLVQDVYTPNVHTVCDTVAVCEELQAEGAFGHFRGHKDQNFLVSSTWGSYFSHNNHDNHTIWFDIITKHSKVCIPSLEYVAEKPLDYEYVHINKR